MLWCVRRLLLPLPLSLFSEALGCVPMMVKICVLPTAQNMLEASPGPRLPLMLRMEIKVRMHHMKATPPPPKKRQKATWGGKGEANMRTLATHMTPGRRVLDFLKGEHPMRDDHLWCNCCGCPIQGRSTYNRRIFGQTNRTPKQQHQRTKAADQRPFGAAEPHGDCRPVLVPGK